VVVVGGGFGGFYALRKMQKLLGPDRASFTLVAPNDYLLYSPLLPEVATGVLDPRDIAVSTRQTLRRTPSWCWDTSRPSTSRIDAFASPVPTVIRNWPGTS
jgi:NADH dehydrogenase FAD-containing subunit